MLFALDIIIRERIFFKYSSTEVNVRVGWDRGVVDEKRFQLLEAVEREDKCLGKRPPPHYLGLKSEMQVKRFWRCSAATWHRKTPVLLNTGSERTRAGCRLITWNR